MLIKPQAKPDEGVIEMNSMKLRTVVALVVLLAIAGLPISIQTAGAHDRNHSPELPSPLCDSLEIPTGNRVAAHAYAVGVQIYRWNGTSWIFVEPVATLFADPNYHDKI